MIMLNLLTLSFLIFSTIILYFNIPSIAGELGKMPIPTPNKLLATYVIDITTGSGITYKFQHFYPLDIAIPLGTTIAWFNDDPEQIHTVTSEKPGSSDSGKLFNSGILPYSSSFQYTFKQPGKFLYHCEIHPWMIGSVYASDSNKQGKNFKLTTGTQIALEDNSSYDWSFNTTEIDRILFDIEPLTVNTEKKTPITYNIDLYNNDIKKEIFSKSFFAKGNDLQFELLSSDLDEALVYGPDLSDPIIGAYHIRDNFPDGTYTLKVEITSIGSNLTDTNISVCFNGRIIS